MSGLLRWSTLIVAVLAGAPAAGQIKGLGDRTVLFQCNFREPGFNLASGVNPAYQQTRPDLAVSLQEEVVAGRTALVTRKADFAVFSDRHKLFGKPITFAVEGQWPGELKIVGRTKADATTILALSPDVFPGSANSLLTTVSGDTHRGRCHVVHLKPADFRL